MTVTLRTAVEEFVSKEAPKERVLLESLDGFDDEQTTRLLKRRSKDPLSFGFAEIATLVTPVVWIAVQEVCRAAAEPAVGALRRRTGALMRRVLRRPAPALTVPPMTAETLEELHGRVCREARTAGLEEDAARALADRVKEHFRPRDPDHPGEPPERP
ncbi:hypothetical protein ACH4SP_00245 [Streptomyces sp. NPDC021093]|uniref:hypothetical protein n=1 Tax=Streptomyces sp. NPDC021093 TaxID=3365112 RepID=UPI0037B2C4E7